MMNTLISILLILNLGNKRDNLFQIIAIIMVWFIIKLIKVPMMKPYEK